MRRVGLAALLLFAACGGGEDKAAAAEFRTDCPAEGTRGLDLSLDVATAAEPRMQSDVTWELTVTNAGAERGTLVFPSAQRGDVVLEQDGDELYRWSRERVFAQSIECVDLDGGERVRIDLGDDQLEFDAGDYDLTATLASDPAPQPHRGQFTVLPR